VFTILHTFHGPYHGDAAYPAAHLVQGIGDNFWGTTIIVSTGGGGAIFRMSASGKFEALFDDLFFSVGLYPYSPLIQGGDDNFYGTTTGEYPPHFVVTACSRSTTAARPHFFTLSPAVVTGATHSRAWCRQMTGTCTARILKEPAGGLFSISPTGELAVLHHFGISARAETTLLQHTNGVLYGETAAGGSSGIGEFYSFDVGLEPFVTFLPAAGVVGRTVDILGQGFTGTTEVSFNGTPATFKVSSDTYLTAIVPKGATNGFMTVTTPGGRLKSNKKFRVTP
jgi:hypothetical protein